MRINPLKWGNVFTVPSEIVDKHIKLAGNVQLKVLLFLSRNLSDGIDVAAISKSLNVSEPDVNDALNFWVSVGILDDEKPKKEEKIHTRKETVKPDRKEIAARSNQDQTIKFILSEAQQKFGRPLRQNETSTLVWLYSDEGMDPAVLLMIIDYAINNSRSSIGYIETTAVDWLNSGIDTVAAAEERLSLLFEQNNAWKKVCTAFSIPKRKPAKKELEFCHKWINQWRFSKEILLEAYDITVLNTTKFTFSYADSILSKWHKSGVKTKYDIEKNAEKKTKKVKNDFGAYDKDLVKQILNKDYE